MRISRELTVHFLCLAFGHSVYQRWVQNRSQRICEPLFQLQFLPTSSLFLSDFLTKDKK